MLALAVIALTCVGCAGSRPFFRGFNHLDDDEVVIIGSVEFDPPLDPSEQSVSNISGNINGRFYLVVDENKERPGVYAPGIGSIEGAVVTQLGEMFDAVIPARTHYVTEGVLFLTLGTVHLQPRTMGAPPMVVQDSGPQFASFPGGRMKIDVRPGDRALYLGTIIYHRVLMKVSSIEIRDDYERDVAKFVEDYGPTPTLEKRLLVAPP